MWKTQFLQEIPRKIYPKGNGEKRHHFPQQKIRKNLSTASLCTTLWIMWKTFYRLELMLMVISLIVWLKTGSDFIFFSICSSEWMTVV